MGTLHWAVIYFFWAIVCILSKTILGQHVTCGHPGAPANGTFAPNGATFALNATVRYKCNDGFILFGSEDRRCLSNGTWTSDIPLCDANVARGKIATQSGQFRQQKASLAIDGQANTCASTPKTPSERWWQLSLSKPHLVSMVAITIGIGVYQDFSIYVVSTEGGDNRIVYNRCGNFSGTFEYNMVEIHCNNGTAIKGEYVFIRDNRQGAYHLSLCEVEVFAVKVDRPCGQPERPLRSIVRPYNKTVAQYSCDTGFKLNTSPYLNCIDGIWDSPPPKCIDLTCAAPPAVPNAKLVPTYAEWFPPPDKSHFPFGAILNYTCYPDFIQEGFNALVCNANGTWTGVQPKCWPTSCGSPPIIANATVQFLNSTAPTGIGSFIELRCHQGLFASSQSIIAECSVNGTWIGLEAVCIDLTEAQLGQGSQSATGPIVAVFVILAIATLIVVAVIYLRKRGYMDKYLKRNLTTDSLVNGISSTTAGSTSVAMSPKPKPTIVHVDHDALYDDVWPSDEALVGDNNSALYADASSCEDLGPNGGESTDRIYDQPDGSDDVDHVYYSPLEGALVADEENIGSTDRSELPPADGAAENLQSIGTTTSNGDHIYEPLRRSTSPSLAIRKPVYAQVDLANKKKGRENDMEGLSEEDEQRVPPDGVIAYATPYVPISGLDTMQSATKRPLPPIPSINRRSSSVMVDNALYGQAAQKAWEALPNDGSEVSQVPTET